MLVGYLHPEDDTDAFDDEGYFRTGDLGRWVDDDYLVVTGRAKDIIIRNGENISPKEIEDILAAIRASPRSQWSGCRTRARANGPAPSIVPAAAPEPDVAEPGRLPRRRRCRAVQSARASGDLGVTAEERRGQDPQASDPRGLMEGAR